MSKVIMVVTIGMTLLWVIALCDPPHSRNSSVNTTTTASNATSCQKKKMPHRHKGKPKQYPVFTSEYSETIYIINHETEEMPTTCFTPKVNPPIYDEDKVI